MEVCPESFDKVCLGKELLMLLRAVAGGRPNNHVSSSLVGVQKINTGSADPPKRLSSGKASAWLARRSENKHDDPDAWEKRLAYQHTAEGCARPFWESPASKYELDPQTQSSWSYSSSSSYHPQSLFCVKPAVKYPDGASSRIVCEVSQLLR